MDYRQLAILALKNSEIKKSINESMSYPEDINERMHPRLEKELREQKTSLGKHPIFPESDENSFEQKILAGRFSEICKRYKRTYDINEINNQHVMSEMMPLVYETMGLESKHKKTLEELAIKMIREEYDMDENIVEINAVLTTNISMERDLKRKTPESIDEGSFNNHDEIVNANEEVYKRRFVNAMIQGAAKKCNHMFHMVDEELTNIDPRLPNKYAKMMASADYLYYVIPEMEKGIVGGAVRVNFPTKENPKAVIYAEAMVFPVLIHEIVKGVMELLSAHGLPKDKLIGEYVIKKADFLAAEPWDMRLGPALWERFTTLIEADDFNLKHHIYSELCKLPVKEFNFKMKEIMANTKEGRKIINDIVTTVKNELYEDEFNNAMTEISEKSNINPNDDGDFDWNDISAIF